MAKRHRNLKLLLPAIEADPHCMKHYLQAVAEYYVTLSLMLLFGTFLIALLSYIDKRNK